MRTWLVLVQVGALYQAQGQTALSLKAAEAIAVKNNPRVSVALLNALAANQTPIEIRSAFYPAAYASVTVAGAIERSRIAAGGLNNPLILDRFASGVTISQLIADFGRTSHLAESASLRARAQEETAKATRAEVLLQVDRAYFNALRAQSVLEVARQTVATRQLVLEQVTALEKSKLRSGLDVSFAGVNLAEAKLLLLSAQNDMEAAFSELDLAMGTRQEGKYTLVEENLPAEPVADVATLVDEALRERPELKQFRLDAEGAKRFADAERDLWRPVISALAAAGAMPFHESALAGRYAAAGINVSIPVFNGRLFSARRAEADLRARAAEQRARVIENDVRRDVQVAWLNASTAFQRLDVTAQLLDQATKARDLAQGRYELGLSSIVELSQAQLNETAAQIAGASAKYNYQIQHAVLSYQTGALR